jgi:hypothetical protein
MSSHITMHAKAASWSMHCFAIDSETNTLSKGAKAHREDAPCAGSDRRHPLVISPLRGGMLSSRSSARERVPGRLSTSHQLTNTAVPRGSSPRVMVCDTPAYLTSHCASPCKKKPGLSMGFSRLRSFSGQLNSAHGVIGSAILEQTGASAFSGLAP